MTTLGIDRTLKDDTIRFDAQAFITVRVGKEPEQQVFLLHEPTVSKRSEFFRRAMNGNWAEKDSLRFELPEDDVEAFRVYTQLVYNNKLATRSTAHGEPLTGQILGQEYELLGKVYVLAEKLQDTLAKNDAVRAIVAVANEKTAKGRWVIPGPCAIVLIYQGTPCNSPARQLLVNLYSRWSSQTLLKRLDNVPWDFVRDLAVSLCGHGRDFAYEFDAAPYLEEVIGLGAENSDDTAT